MNDLVLAGTTVPIRVLMYDGATPQTGETVVVSIERLADGYYWNGAGWQAGHTTNAMSELSGDAHRAGIYEYDFAVPSTVGVFDWRVNFDGDVKRAFAGRIDSGVTQAVLDIFVSAMPELTGLVSATPTLQQAVMTMLMHFRNVTTSGGLEGLEKLQIRNDAGAIIMEADESFVDGTNTYTKGKFASP